MANQAVCLVTWVCREEGPGWNLPVHASNTFPSTHLIPPPAGLWTPWRMGRETHTSPFSIYLGFCSATSTWPWMRKHLPPEGQCVLMQVSSQPLLLRGKVSLERPPRDTGNTRTDRGGGGAAAGAGVPVLGIDCLASEVSHPHELPRRIMGVEHEEKAGCLTESFSPPGREYRCLLMKLRVSRARNGKDQRM